MADEIEQALWSIAEDRAREHGYPFAEGSEDHLRRLISTGAREMEQRRIAPDSPEMETAKEKLRQFVDEMANAVGEQGLNEFREPTFFAAFKRLCPGFFPFC